MEANSHEPQRRRTLEVERDLRARWLMAALPPDITAVGGGFGIVFREADPPKILSRASIFGSKSSEHQNTMVLTFRTELR
jgi:hypothetical protein